MTKKTKNTNRPTVAGTVAQIARDAASDNFLAVRNMFAATAENKFARYQGLAAAHAEYVKTLPKKAQDAARIEVTQKTIKAGFTAMGYTASAMPELGKNDPARSKVWARTVGAPDCASALSALTASTLDAVARAWTVSDASRAAALENDPKADYPAAKAEDVIAAVRKAAIDAIRSGLASDGEAFRAKQSDVRIVRDLGGIAAKTLAEVDPANPVQAPTPTPTLPPAPVVGEGMYPNKSEDKSEDKTPEDKTPEDKSDEQDTAKARYTEARDKLASLMIMTLDAMEGDAKKTKAGVVLPIPAGGKAEQLANLMTHARRIMLEQR